MSTIKCKYSLLKAKSRSDDTLLTVDFNLRAKSTTPSPQVPQGRHLSLQSIVPAGLGGKRGVCIRRLRFALPTVNKVLSHAGHFAVDTTLIKNPIINN